MKVVYIAGPYGDAGGYLAIERNIAAAREAAAELANNDVGFFCPHMNSAHFECIIEQPPEFWYELDLRLLDACDAIFMVPGWENSKGAIRERSEASMRGMPVFYNLADVGEWIAKEQGA